MDSTALVIDMTFDTSSFDLPRCTSLFLNGDESELETKLPDPQPFIRRKRSSDIDAGINIKFLQASRAAIGKEIVECEPGKWNIGMDERQKSAEKIALCILQCRT